MVTPRLFRTTLAALACASATLLSTAAAQAKPNWGLVYAEPNSGNVMFGLSAVDASHAWALGVSSSTGNTQAVGVRTMDGTTWLPMSLPPIAGFIKLYMLVAFQDAQVGWMQGMNGQTVYLWRTDDGGGQWAQVFQSPNLMNQLQALPDGAVFGAGVSQVLISKDGALFTEKSVTLPAGMELNGIAMLNSTCGFAVAAMPSDASSEGSAVLWTGDGGETWEARGDNRDFRMNRASFVSPTLGWAAGSRSGKAIVAKTTDGGASWNPIAIADHEPVMGQPQTVPATSCVDVKFFDDQRGVAACLSCTAECDGAEGANPSYLTVFVRSEDGGQTWSMDPDYEPVMNAPPFGAMMKFSGMMAMAFPEPNTGFLSGTNNLILRYTAAAPEAAGWGPASCDPAGAGGGSSGTGGGSGSPGATGGSSDSESGCGCSAPHGRSYSGWALAALGAALIALARRRG